MVDFIRKHQFKSKIVSTRHPFLVLKRPRRPGRIDVFELLIE